MKIRKIKDFLLEYGEALGGLVSIPVALFSVVATAFSIIATVIALWIGYDANKTAEEAMALAQKDYYSKRKLVLKGEVSPSPGEIRFASADEAQFIQTIKVFFPDKDGALSATLFYPDRRLDLSPSLPKILSSYIEKAGADYDYIGAEMPVVVMVDFISRNEAFQNLGLYQLYFRKAKDKPFGIEGFRFVKHIDFAEIKTNPHDYLATIWEATQIRAWGGEDVFYSWSTDETYDSWSTDETYESRGTEQTAPLESTEPGEDSETVP